MAAASEVIYHFKYYTRNSYSFAAVNDVGIICYKRPYTVRVRPLVCLGTLGSLIRFVGGGGEVFQFFAAVADFLGFLRSVCFEFFGELAVCRGYYARRH